MTGGSAGDHPASNCPSVAAVAGLAREVEGLRRRLNELTDLPGRVAEVAELVAQLAEHAAATSSRGSRREAGGTVSWLAFPTGPDQSRDAEAVLGRLVGWVAAVYLRYADAAAGLPDCWLWHPDVVEELLWLYHAWLIVYRPDAATAAVGDWHDRQRPGVVHRIRDYAARCALKTHQAGGEHAAPAPTVVMAEMVPTIAAWWTTGRQQPGPAPTDEQVAAVYEAWRRRPRGTL
jgi:hypothetical protein